MNYEERKAVFMVLLCIWGTGVVIAFAWVGINYYSCECVCPCTELFENWTTGGFNFTPDDNCTVSMMPKLGEEFPPMVYKLKEGEYEVFNRNIG